MVAASYPLGVNEPELQGRATMRAMQFQETDCTAQIAKNHQFLAEDFDPMGQVLQFVGKADRLPKSAQIFAAWCVGADTGEFCVVVGHLAMEVAAISRLQETGSGNRFSSHLPFPSSHDDSASTQAVAPAFHEN
jgi:hypothetical protein